ncbi:RIP metalloprotease RseP [Bacteriovoracaceae bacterium]|nr:RIP metalloprotease RseP [Bacteriovoracaceae bacterium]
MEFFEKIFIFCLFLAPLIFFHELGHFLFARLAGVRVEVFSIGFGPKLLHKKIGDTVYTISLIPLGGYVKMFGEDPLKAEELSAEEKEVAYTSKSKWARFWIVFGGPLANFIFAYVIYFFLLLGGEKVPSPKIGYVDQSHSYYNIGLRTGDILKEVNGYEIASFDDLNSIGDPVEDIKVARGAREIKLNMNDVSKIDFVQSIMKMGAIFRAPLLVDNNNNKFVVSGYENFYNLSVSLEELESIFIENGSVYIHAIEKDAEYKVTDKVINSKSTKTISLKQTEESNLLGDYLFDSGYYSLDMVVKSIVMSSPAEKIGLKKGDILVSLNGVKLTSFEKLRNQLQRYIDQEEEIILESIQKGELNSFSFKPDIKMVGEQKIASIGIYSMIEYIAPQMITTPSKGLIGSFSHAFERTWQGMVGVTLMFKKLILGEVSVSNLGGPLAIGKVANDSFYMGISMFMRLMAMISINLGLINLFPIPVLDGGHIVFILFELVNRGPLSKKKIQVAQQFGLSLLLGLIVVALYNDFSNFVFK